MTGAGLAGVSLSIGAGLVTLVLVLRRRFEPARYTAALADITAPSDITAENAHDRPPR